MTRSNDPRLAVVDRWYAAYGGRNVDALLAVADPEIEVLPVEPLLSKLAGASFHGHAGLRTLAEWSYTTYPLLRLESSVTERVPGWIRATAKFVVDDHSTPTVRRSTDTLFDVNGGGLVRRVRSFLSDSKPLELAMAQPVLTAREREIFQLLARGMTSPEIAAELVLSPTTVRTHVQNGVSRLGANTRLQALALAIRRGEVEP